MCVCVYMRMHIFKFGWRCAQHSKYGKYVCEPFEKCCLRHQHRLQFSLRLLILYAPLLPCSPRRDLIRRRYFAATAGLSACHHRHLLAVGCRLLVTLLADWLQLARRTSKHTHLQKRAIKYTCKEPEIQQLLPSLSEQRFTHTHTQAHSSLWLGVWLRTFCSPKALS